MLDVSRHFFPREDVKRLLHTMALFKMNRFHWHLTDDQGWRFPVEKYPALTKIGGYRRATQSGHDMSKDDGKPYNGSYTEEDIQDIVKFAESLHIEIVPEVDVPGHFQAAIAAYPQFGNNDSFSSAEVATHFGVNPYTLAPKEQSIKFVKDILAEMAHLIPTNYIHVGGDEVPTGQWQNSKFAQDFARHHDLPMERMEGFLLESVTAHVAKLGRHAIVWDEALSSGGYLAPGTVIMLWRQWEHLDALGNEAQARNFPVVMAPQGWTYFDQFQAPNGRGEKYDAIGGYLNLEKVYSMPLTAGSARVLGGQGQVWSEYVVDGDDLDYMAWPRGCALAEATWSGSSKPGFQDFMHRLRSRLQDLRSLKIKFRELDGNS